MAIGRYRRRRRDSGQGGATIGGWRSGSANRWPRILAAVAVVVGLSLLVDRWLGDPKTLNGTARVIDGDTFDLCKGSRCRRIRICGINTPERDEAGYQEARKALAQLVRGAVLRCTAVGHGTVCDGRSRGRSHDRLVAQCWLPSGEDVAEQILRQGHACELTGFTAGYYGRRTKVRACTGRQ